MFAKYRKHWAWLFFLCGAYTGLVFITLVLSLVSNSLKGSEKLGLLTIKEINMPFVVLIMIWLISSFCTKFEMIVNGLNEGSMNFNKASIFFNILLIGHTVYLGKISEVIEYIVDTTISREYMSYPVIFYIISSLVVDIFDYKYKIDRKKAALTQADR